MKKIALASAVIALFSGMTFADTVSVVQPGFTPRTNEVVITVNGNACRLKTSLAVGAAQGCNYQVDLNKIGSGDASGAKPQQMNGCSLKCE